MAAKHVNLADIQGFGRLVVGATIGVTDLVEEVHHTVTWQPRPLDPAAPRRTRGITGFVYGNVRGVTRLVGGTLDLALTPFVAYFDQTESSTQRAALVAALNGILGDHLAATDNPLALPMTLSNPATLESTPVSGRVIIFVHGLCMNDAQWARAGVDQSQALAAELGYTPRYLRYNSGLHIATNGRAFADLLEQTMATWPQPVTELVIVGHSMGGLVTRSALHYAQEASHQWPQLLRKLVFLGSPHHGAPLERGGAWIDTLLGATPYIAPFARLGRMRSAGITDLRHGNLRDEDRASGDRFAHRRDTRRPTPLPAGVQCYTAAATLGPRTGNPAGRLLGDGLVPLDSALGRHRDPRHALAIPPQRQWVGYELGHLDLLWSPAVFAQVRTWLAEDVQT